MKEVIIKLRGGLDVATGAIARDPGNLIGSENYEPRLEGGVQRIKGYERYDGQPKPSDARFVVLGAVAWHASAIVGATLTGDDSAATGVICYTDDTADPALRAVTQVVGTFVAGEDVLVGATTVATDVQLEPSISAATSNSMYEGAANIYRADIEAVPGSGPIRGVCVVAGVVYAFRDNVGATAQAVWKATSAGWAAIDYPTVYRIFFTGGSGGSGGSGVTLTQGGVTATVHRVMKSGGSWTAGDATGVLALRGAASGGSFVNGAATLSSGETLDLVAVTYVAYPLAAGGRWEFRPYRFQALLSLLDVSITPVYGCDRMAEASGGGNAIEFDGQMAVPLLLGGIDGPYHLVPHKQQLFAVQRRTSLQFGAPGDPYDFTVLSGAGEVLVGAPIAALEPVVGSEDRGAMAVLGSNRSDILYGNDAADYQLVNLSTEVGAKQYSTQIMDDLIGLDEQGARYYSPNQNFGNFGSTTLTNHIRRKVTGRNPVASVINRADGRYRLFFDDQDFLVGVPGKRWSWTLCRYPFQVWCASEWEIDGVSTIFMGDEEDGYVYQADVGRSFDGAAIRAWLKTGYAHCGSPHLRKAFRLTFVEIRGDSVGSIYLQPDYTYGSTELDEQDSALSVNAPILGSDGAFDLGEWDVGSWDAQYLSNLRVRSPGVGSNVATLLFQQTAVELSHEITSVTHRFEQRREQR